MAAIAKTNKTNQAPKRGRIVTDPKVHGGKPTVRDTGVQIEHILAQLAVKPDVGAVLAGSPELTSEDIQAVMSYARAAVQALPVSNSTRPVAATSDIWAKYDPETVMPAFEALREALRGVDLDELYADIREARGHPREKLPR